MYQVRHAALCAIIALASLGGCSKSSGTTHAPTCGADGATCCPSASPCGDGLSCQANVCRAGTVACGGSGQACCATGTSCAAGLSCAGNSTCATPPQTSVTKVVCATGGTLTVAGATLTVPAEALEACTSITLAANAAEVPSGYTAFSSVYSVTPAALTFLVPASLTVSFEGDASVAALFWSRPDTTGLLPAAGTLTATTVRGPITHGGYGFVANGVDYVDEPDRSCVVGKLVEGRTLPPSNVALFFTVDDCWGRPVVGFTQSDFALLENGEAVSPAESAATILQRNGLQVFASMVIDVSASTHALLPDVIAAAKAFVNRLQVQKHLPVQIDIQLFAGDEDLREWQAPTLDSALLETRLDALAALLANEPPLDHASTNLNGAVVAALGRIELAQEDFRSRNLGGAFTTGYLVLFTDGKDTAGRVSASDALAAVVASAQQVVAVGLESAEYDGAALANLAPNGVITVADSTQLTLGFAALAQRMEGQINRTYLLGYCSPKRAGAKNEVAVTVAGAENTAQATYVFDATDFAPGCSTATFTSACDGKQCGGLGCGACDDRVASCDAATLLCVAH